MNDSPKNKDTITITSLLDSEYRVAADTYMHGVNIGYTVIRNFVALNAVFFGALGLVNSNPESNIAQMNGFIKMIPIFAILTSLLLAVAFPYYKRHLDNCSTRCAQIEEHFSGKLFTRMNEIEDKKTIFSAQVGFNAIVLIFIIVWSVVAYHLKSWTLISIT